MPASFLKALWKKLKSFYKAYKEAFWTFTLVSLVRSENINLAALVLERVTAYISSKTCFLYIAPAYMLKN